MPNRGFQNWKAKNKPSGLYKAGCWEESCDYCAYQGQANHCNLRHETIRSAEKMKCRDWMHKDKGTVEFEETLSP